MQRQTDCTGKMLEAIFRFRANIYEFGPATNTPLGLVLFNLFEQGCFKQFLKILLAQS